jgi:hypothetical protein
MSIGRNLIDTGCIMMSDFLTTRIMQSLIVPPLVFVTVSIGWSASELLLNLERWRFQVQPGNYSVIFTIKLSNDYDRPIQRIDAFLYFEDALGNRLEKVYIKPHIKIPPRGSREYTWTYIMNPFAPMLKMNPGDIRASLDVRGITFSTGERMPFTIGSGVIY